MGGDDVIPFPCFWLMRDRRERHDTKDHIWGWPAFS